MTHSRVYQLDARPGTHERHFGVRITSGFPSENFYRQLRDACGDADITLAEFRQIPAGFGVMVLPVHTAATQSFICVLAGGTVLVNGPGPRFDVDCLDCASFAISPSTQLHLTLDPNIVHTVALLYSFSRLLVDR